MIESVWQPVVPHLRPPAPPPPAWVTSTPRKPLRGAPITEASWTWLNKNPMASAGDLARGMDIPIHRAGAHLERMVRNKMALKHLNKTSNNHAVAKYFYTALPLSH